MPVQPYLGRVGAVEKFSIVQECADCGLMSRLDSPVPGAEACCPRCDNVLRRLKRNAYDRGGLWAVVALPFAFLILTFPLLKVWLFGGYRRGLIGTGPIVLDDQGYWMLAAVVLLTTVVMPLIKVGGMCVVLACLRLRYRPRWLAGLYVIVRQANYWVLLEVYFLGFLIAYSRLQSFVHVQPAVGVLGLCGLMLSVIAMDAAIDSEAIWGRIKKREAVDLSSNKPLIGCDICFQVSNASPFEKCSRCGSILQRRKTNSLSRTGALTLAAAILYVPSNIYPVMSVLRLGRATRYTIYDGMRELAATGLWPLAALVFIASIAIPVFKLVALALMLAHVRRGSASGVHKLTRLYRMIEFIGRWSMADIFMISILVAVVNFGWFAKITAETGAVYFASVVVLTLLAAKSFDPRLLWDAVLKHRPKE